MEGKHRHGWIEVDRRRGRRGRPVVIEKKNSFKSRRLVVNLERNSRNP